MSGVGILIWIVMVSRMNGNPLSVLYLRVERVTGRTGFSSYSSDTQPKQPVVKTHPLCVFPFFVTPSSGYSFDGFSYIESSAVMDFYTQTAGSNGGVDA